MTRIEDLDLSIRCLNLLKSVGINHLEELCFVREEDLLKYLRFGHKSLSELKEVMKEYNLNFY